MKGLIRALITLLIPYTFRFLQSCSVGTTFKCQKENMSSTVNRVFVGGLAVPDLPDRVRKALKANGDGDRIEVVELSVLGQHGNARLAEESIRRLPEMEYVYSDPDLIGQIFCHPESRLKWAQSGGAGCDKTFIELKKTQKKPKFIMTRRDEGYATMMREYVIGEIIARERHFTKMDELQRQCKFDNPAVNDYRLLDTLTVGILGLGSIGTEVARVCKALNMTVLCVVRDERYSAGNTVVEHADDVRPLSQLSSVLESCDYFVSVVPATAQTVNLLSGKVLQPCHKKKTVLINVGRGSVIDDDSLVNAIRSGWLGGAILDVFNEEPLPPSSPLWTLPGVTITPHVSAMTTPNMSTDSFIFNLNAYREGRPMKNVVDFERGY